MDKAEISKLRNTIIEHLDGHRLSLAFKHLKEMIDSAAQWELVEQLNGLVTSYNYMLQYLSQGILDPERDNILSQIVAETYELTDKTVIALATAQSTHLFYQRHQQYNNRNLMPMIDEYFIEQNKLRLVNSVDDNSRDATAASNILRRCENIESNIFNKVWSSFPIAGADVETIKSLLQNDEAPAHLKSLVLSALMLGSTKFFDAPKLKLLIDNYAWSENPEVQLRSLVNAVIVIYLYRNRLKYYKEITESISALEAQPSFKSDIQLIFTRLIHSRNTDNISRKMREGIMPELQKMSPDLFSKIKGKTPGTIDIGEIEENPQWQQWLDESGITRKLEQFNEIQLEGGDVFISTFSRLKSYPFFNTLSNWFLPYHDNCSAIISAFGGKKHPLSSLFKMMPVLCDSDKYSMLLSIASAPDSQREMMISQFEAQREQFQELQSEQAQSLIKKRDFIVNCYIQDLYRFFKLYSRRREFKSVFDTNINLTDADCLKPYLSDTPTLSVIAEFYFKNGFYDDAIKFYRNMVANHDADPHIYQKIAYSYQSLGKCREALKNYSLYELVDGNDTWNTKQMAQCYRSMHDHDNAIECYRRALEMSPQSVTLCLSMGHCYLDKGDYDNALQQYYKADFMPTARHRAWRPIAWCSLLTGKHEQAVNYYEKIINEDVPTSQDYLNYGHLLQSMGRITEAIDKYRKSLQLENNDIEAFAKLYSDDRRYMVGKMSIPESDYAIVLDAVINNL